MQTPGLDDVFERVSFLLFSVCSSRGLGAFVVPIKQNGLGYLVIAIFNIQNITTSLDDQTTQTITCPYLRRNPKATDKPKRKIFFPLP